MSDVQSVYTPSHKFRIDAGRTKFGQKTDGILNGCGSYAKEHQDPYDIDLEAPRLAWYKQKKWRVHQDTVYWVGIKLAQKRGFKFYPRRSNAIILVKTLPAYCIPKVVRKETGEVIYQKVFASPRPPPKISLKHDWMKELGSLGRYSACLMERIQKLLEAAKIRNEYNQNQKPNYQERGDRRWTKIHKGNRQRHPVWSRGHQALNENGEIRMWIRIHTKLRVDAYKKLKRIKQERRDP